MVSNNSELLANYYELNPMAIEATLYSKYLKEFIKAFWHVVEPGTPFIDNWHIDAIAEHLEAVTKGQIRNLLINMPPRCAKSLIVSVFWPTWSWTFKPESRWLFSSYIRDLSQRDNMKCRRIIESNLYQKLYGDVFKLTSDQNTKNRFENDKTGYRISTSVDGSGTGEGGDFIVVDDPQSASEATSELKVRSTLDWWDNVMSTRGNDPKTVARVIVMQRLADNDLSGHVLEQGGYEHLLLPMEYESERKCVTGIGWQDPRQADGELLWPARFTNTELNDLKVRLGPYGYAGQMQQRPVPLGGGEFKREWIDLQQRFTNHNPTDSRHMNRYIIIDPANSKKATSDYTAMIVVGLGSDKNYYILDIIRDRLDLKERTDRVFELHRKWQPLKIGYERYGMQADIQHIRSEMQYRNYRFHIEELGGTKLRKEERIRRLIPLFAARRIFLPEVLYITNYAGQPVDLVKQFVEEEYNSFPLGLHDDMMDALSRITDEEFYIEFPREQPHDYHKNNRQATATHWQAW